MQKNHNYFVYLLCSSSRRALYTGVTAHLAKRVLEHRGSDVSTFCGKYKAHRLVHFETFHLVDSAIAREKEIKSWRRSKKDALVREHNPAWRDLMEDFGF